VRRGHGPAGIPGWKWGECVGLVHNHRHSPGKGTPAPACPVLLCRLDAPPHVDVHVNGGREHEQPAAVQVLHIQRACAHVGNPAIAKGNICHAP